MDILEESLRSDRLLIHPVGAHTNWKIDAQEALDVYLVRCRETEDRSGKPRVVDISASYRCSNQRTEHLAASQAVGERRPTWFVKSVVTLMAHPKLASF